MPTRVLILTNGAQTRPTCNGAQTRPTCSVHFFGCTRNAAHDFEHRLRAAVAEWLASQEGQCVRVQIGDARFDWGHAIDGVPPELWRKHGLTLRTHFFGETETLLLHYQPVAPMQAKEKRCRN